MALADAGGGIREAYARHAAGCSAALGTIALLAGGAGVLGCAHHVVLVALGGGDVLLRLDRREDRILELGGKLHQPKKRKRVYLFEEMRV